jgi:hypothetical protein
MTEPTLEKPAQRVPSIERKHLLPLVAAIALAIAGCQGWMSVDGTSEVESPESEGAEQTGGSNGGGPHDGEGPDLDRRTPASIGGLKRLTRLEYDNSLRQLVGPPSAGEWTYGEEYLPGLAPKPFSNDMFRQEPSTTLVQGLKQSAEEAASTVAAQLGQSSAMRNYVLGCEPAGANDEACFRTFLERFGRRAFRRPIEPKEIDRMTRRFVDLEQLRSEATATNRADLRRAAENATFYEKVQLAMQAILQHPEFIYRKETGEKVPERGSGETAVRKLDDYSVASRLSYFIWGQPPDGPLLEAAAKGHLETADQIRKQARRMLDEKAARERMYQFHASWLNFQSFWLGRNNKTIPDAQADAMREETRRLLRRVIFEEEENWLTIFQAERTWVEPALAEYYDFVDPEDFEDGEGRWIRYPEEGLRRGILSHGAFLTNGRRPNGDTHIIRRSEVILHRLMCDDVGAPPDDAPSNVEDAEGANQAECKVEKLDAATLRGSCAGCHYKLNKLGGALENFDNKGRYRKYESDQKDCEIEGDGGLYQYENKTWDEVVDFRGPKGLANTLVQRDEVAECMVKHLYEFALGHSATSGPDEEAIDVLREYFRASEYQFDDLVVELAASDAFRYRRILPDGEKPDGGH